MNSLKCAPGQTPGAEEATEAPTGVGNPATEAAWEELVPGETTDTVPRLHAATVAPGPTEQEKNAGLWAKNAITVVDLDISQKYAGRGQTIKITEKTAVKHIDTEEQPPDYFQSEYTTPYFIANEQAKAPIKCLKTTARVHHIQDRDTEHIRPLWISQSKGPQIFQTDCEVDTGAGCNILPANKAKQLLGQE